MSKAFRFKQFEIYQDLCGMKISSVATVLGALAEASNNGRILDIGTGTGLLTLMLAQKYPDAVLVAVEKDPDAALQARGNFERSPWKGRISLIQEDILALIPANQSLKNTFDTIICNPPFFSKQYPSPDEKRNLARHTQFLTPQNLALAGKFFLHNRGSFWILVALPFLEEVIAQFMKNGYFLSLRYDIADNLHTPKASCSVLQWSFVPSQPIKHEIFYLRDEKGNHSLQAQTLLKDYLIIF